MNIQNILFRKTKNRIRGYFRGKASRDELLTLEGAFMDIDHLYRNQYRFSGVPAVLHSLRVGTLLCDLGADFRAVIAGLLHDTLEDTDLTSRELRQGYGNWMADISTSLKKSHNHHQTHQKLMQAGHRDVRSLVIKFCDRLDNMREIQWLAPHKRRRISRESREFYLPLASKIGIPTDLRDEMKSLTSRFI
ncbi:HD domain-containing protein [bacterium]|nr:HD domain-containing protein [bacterium]